MNHLGTQLQTKQLIRAFPDFKKEVEGVDYLNVSELYYDTIQGEGINIGHPAAFLRLQGCIMDCIYCDTTEVWRAGNPYTFEELIEIMNSSMIIREFTNGQHLVITGGSPLKQQKALVRFLWRFKETYNFVPYIEIENECVFTPLPEILEYISCWNNSPKLASSNQSAHLRYHPEVLRWLSHLDNSWFKFVISKPNEWDEIQRGFLNPGLICKDQIILMPEGATRRELEKNLHLTVELAIQHNVRYCTREHIVLWDRKTGV